MRADLIYTLNGGERDEEWFRKPATMPAENIVSVKLPEGTTHYVINLIDENNFLRSYPEIAGSKQKYSEHALAVKATSDVKMKSVAKPSAAFSEKDANKDGRISKEEYVSHFALGFDRKDKNRDGVLTPNEHAHASFTAADGDKNEHLTRVEFASIFERQFRRMDQDENGFVTPDEINP